MTTSSIGYWCSLVAHRYFELLQLELKHLDMTQWFFVLLTIEEAKGKLSQQELADQLDLDKVAMTRALDHLSGKGYIERCDCEGDRRKYLVKLTPKARPAVKAIRQAYDDLNRTALKGLTKAERTQFMTHLTKVNANLRPTGEPTPISTKRVHV